MKMNEMFVPRVYTPSQRALVVVYTCVEQMYTCHTAAHPSSAVLKMWPMSGVQQAACIHLHHL
jgi:hypothetical protein